MNTVTQNITIKEKAKLANRHIKIVQQDWLRTIELKLVNEQLKAHMVARLTIKTGASQVEEKTNKVVKENQSMMKYIFPALVVLLSVIILM